MKATVSDLHLFLTRRPDNTRVTLPGIPEKVPETDSVKQEWYKDIGRAHIWRSVKKQTSSDIQ